MKKVSIIIPAYNEEGNIERTSEVVLGIMDEAGITCELVFVSDGSSDGTYSKILECAKKDNRVKGIEFSKNFGKESAIFAGLEKGTGDCFVVMDCDLQHPPKTIVEMYRMWEAGYDIVEGVKASRGKEKRSYGLLARAFYRIISRMTGFDMQNSSDFKLIDRKVAEVLLRLPERKVFFRALSFWSGFKSGQVSYEVAEREIGESKWSTRKLIRYAVTNITSFTSAPLNLVTYLGVISFILLIVMGIQTLVRYIMGYAVEGFTTVILLLLLLGSGILIGLGIIGYYISAIYEEIKGRPRYIVWHDTDAEKKEDVNDGE